MFVKQNNISVNDYVLQLSGKIFNMVPAKVTKDKIDGC